MLNLKKEWKESESILGKLRQEAKKKNSRKLLLTDIMFSLAMISFLVLLNSVVIQKVDNVANFNLAEYLFFASSAVFSVLCFIIMYTLAMANLGKEKLVKK